LAVKLPSPEELFKQFDTNGDGSISKEEFVAGVQKVREKFREIMQARFAGQEGRHFGPMGMTPPSPAELQKMKEHFQQRMKEHAQSAATPKASTPAKKSETTPKTDTPPKK
jgi:hypothetical protein